MTASPVRQVSITTTIRRVPSAPTPPPAGVQLYQYGDDYRVLGGLRTCAAGGCPAVMVLNDAPDTIMDLHWQMHLVASNPGMSLNAIAATIGSGKALLNNQGVGDENKPRANYIQRSNIGSPDPRLDKLRTLALNTHAGTEVYRLLFAIQNIFAEMKAVLYGRSSFMQIRQAMVDITANNALIVQTMDGNNPPPMKPGARRPTRVEEINPDDYLILPSPETRHLFLDCTNIAAQAGGEYKIGPWANGSTRPWIGDDRIHTLFPLVSKYEIVSPLRNWIKIPLGNPFPSPFYRPS